jgi:Ca2+-binding RTX toxin-like protein
LGTASGILGGIKGFQALLGGSGDDQLTAGDNTTLLDGGPGNDMILINLAGSPSGGQIFGGDGRDTFVLSGMEAIQAGSVAGEPALPPLWALADLSLETTASGGIGLTDILQWRQQGIQTAPWGASTTITLTSAGLEGLGQPQLLPIAPLAQLLAGMNAMALNGQQLAIAAGPNNSSLLLLGADRSYSTIAELPSLRLASTLQPNTSAMETPAGLAG